MQATDRPAAWVHGQKVNQTIAYQFPMVSEDNILIPRTLMTKIKKPWRIADGMAIVAELQSKTSKTLEAENDWESLLLVRTRTGVDFADLMDSIRAGRLTVGQRVGVKGFHGFALKKSEADRLANVLGISLQRQIKSLPGVIAAAAFGRSIGLRDSGQFVALIDAGHTPALKVFNPRTNRLQYQLTQDNLTDFHRRFVTLTTLHEETGLHRNTLRARVAASQIAPFAPDGQSFGAVFLRVDAIKAIRRP